MTDFRQNLSGSGMSYRRAVNGTDLERLSASGFALTVPLSAYRINGIDGMRNFGALDGGAATATTQVNPGSGTVFNIPPNSTVGQLFALAPSAIDRDLMLLQNRSVATHAIYNPGAASGRLCFMNPSGAAWVRFNSGSGTWELHGRTQMGF